MVAATPRRALALAIALCLGALGSSPANADGGSVYSSGLFQLGDGQPPAGFGGLADIAATPDQAGPDWADLFDAQGGLRDDYPLGADGAPQGNGVPDLIDRFGGRWGVFVADDVSLGSGFEGTASAGGGEFVKNGVASAAGDIGNVYFYGTRDASGNNVVFLGIERLSGADGTVELEIGQNAVGLGHGGYGHGVPWKVEGERADGDVLLSLSFVGGQVAAAAVGIRSEGGWHAIAGTTGEGCDVAELLCALSNRESIAKGPWPSVDGGSGEIGAGLFVEVGINVGALLGAQTQERSLRVRTSEDVALGHVEGN
jgi:hypothetical protein